MSNSVIFIVSGPSGAGKGTLVKLAAEKMGEENAPIFSVSMTTRMRSQFEVDGVDYYFTDDASFERRIAEDYFAEYNYYSGCYYGTPRDNIVQAQQQGRDLLIEIDLNGMRQVARNYPDAVKIFIMPPSMGELEGRIRLRGRSSDTEEKIQSRLQRAREEIECAGEYDYIILNDNLQEATDELIAVYRAEHCRSRLNKNLINEVLN